MFRIKQKQTLIAYLLRIGVFGTFLGHGLYAVSVKESWIHLITAVGFSKEFAVKVMPVIGVTDIIVAFTILMYPVRAVLVWAVFWTFITALSRPFSGEPFLEFLERFSGWVVPLVLLLLISKGKDASSSD